MPARRPIAVAVCATGVLPLIAGCAQPLVVDAAPYAGDPDCARVMIAMPETVGGLARVATTSQATDAWGEEYPMVARCGVEPPGPTTDTCIAVDAGGVTVDWLVIEEDDSWRTTTFGRSPAVELTVPLVRAQEAIGDVLAEVSQAAARSPRNGLECR